ncbi:MAG: c-type cytochrome domain-containing protein, partial [Planctomycetaceae bacterium]
MNTCEGRGDWRLNGSLGLSVAIVLAAAGWSFAADYRRDVLPLLATKCVSCHGPVKQEAGLRLDAGSLVRQGSD